MKKILTLMISLIVISGCAATYTPSQKAEIKSDIFNRLPVCRSQSNFEAIQACAADKMSITRVEYDKINQHVKLLNTDDGFAYIASLEFYKRNTYMRVSPKTERIAYFASRSEKEYLDFFKLLTQKEQSYVRKSGSFEELSDARLKYQSISQKLKTTKLNKAKALKNISDPKRVSMVKEKVSLALTFCVNGGFLTPSSLDVANFLNRSDAKLSYKLYFFQKQFTRNQKERNSINESAYADVIEQNKNYIKYSKDRKKAQTFCSEFLNKATNGKVAINDMSKANKIKKSVIASNDVAKNKAAQRDLDIQRVKVLDKTIAKQKGVIKSHTPIYYYARVMKDYGDGLFLATQNDGFSFFLISDHSETITKAGTYKFTELVDTKKKQSMVDGNGFESELRVYNISNKKLEVFEKWKRGKGKAIVKSLEKNQSERNKLVVKLNKKR